MRNLLLLSFTFLLAALAQAEQPVSPPALLTIHNSSTYKMTPVVWRNGKKCTDRMRLDDSQNPNQTDPKPLAVYSLQLLTVAVGIFEMEDKAPVQCEWSRSFRPQPGARYRLDLDVQDRHCYGNLFRYDNGRYVLVMDNDNEKPNERQLAFGWDSLEPGCEDN